VILWIYSICSQPRRDIVGQLLSKCLSSRLRSPVGGAIDRAVMTRNFEPGERDRRDGIRGAGTQRPKAGAHGDGAPPGGAMRRQVCV
jgi:hypothetical protein